MEILFLEGSWEEIGEGFGRSLNKSAHESIRYMLSGSERIAKHAAQESTLKRLLFKLAIKAMIKTKTLRKTREPEADFFKGFEKASGYKGKDLLAYFYSPDTSNYIMALSDKILKRSVPPVLLGCSSFVALPEATQSQKTYHGRNLDYIGGRYWEKGHCIAVLKPKGALASVNVMTLGIFCPGITAVNEEGIGISLHLNFTKSIRFKNRPITSTVFEIVSRARNISEAIDIARKNPPMAGWTIIISSAKEREAAAVELCASQSNVLYPENGLVYYTNTYISQNLRDTEYAPSYIWVENNHSRLSRLKALLFKELGKLSPERMVKILSDTWDPVIERKTALGHTLSNAANISSALISYDEDTIWVSDSPVPANRGTFKGYSISSLFSGKPETKGELAPQRLPEAKEKAFRNFVEACFEWEETASPSRAHGFMAKAAAEDPEEALYAFNSALMLAKMGEHKKALDIVEKILNNHSLSPTREAQITLWCARLKDLCSQREEALELYRKVIKTRAPLDMLKKAEKGINRPYSEKDLKRLDLLPFIADTIE